jgi:ABC-type uncharacterized transport system substrate-binding protein
MATITHIRPEFRLLRARLLSLIAVLVAGFGLAGCSSLFRETATGGDQAADRPEAAVVPAEQIPVVVDHPPPPLPPEPAEPAVETVHDVLVLYAGNNSAAAELGAEIESALAPERYLPVALDINRPGFAVDASRAEAIVAVGVEAAELARSRYVDRPIIFCQVFDADRLLERDRRIWAVSAVPPLALQLRGWKAVDPSLERIGLIISEEHAGLIAEADAAARGVRAKLTYEYSTSDRETLYLFKRLAPELDGLWLFPDNSILSPPVLRELLDYAVSHDVSVMAFNDALLPWGALVSAESLPEDVAAAVQNVLDHVFTDRGGELPPVTALSEAALVFNADAATRLGLAELAETSWVLREPD